MIGLRRTRFLSNSRSGVWLVGSLKVDRVKVECDEEKKDGGKTTAEASLPKRSQRIIPPRLA